MSSLATYVGYNSITSWWAGHGTTAGKVADQANTNTTVGAITYNGSDEVRLAEQKMDKDFHMKRSVY